MVLGTSCGVSCNLSMCRVAGGFSPRAFFNLFVYKWLFVFLCQYVLPLCNISCCCPFFAQSLGFTLAMQVSIGKLQFAQKQGDCVGVDAGRFYPPALPYDTFCGPVDCSICLNSERAFVQNGVAGPSENSICARWHVL